MRDTRQATSDRLDTQRFAFSLPLAACRLLRSYRSGFTLVELLLVVVILSILAAMVVPRLAGRSEQARIARAEADVKGAVPLALDIYEVDNGMFPTTEQGLSALLDTPTSQPAPKNWRGPYLKRPPVDPWGHPYAYEYPAQRASGKADYDLFSAGPDGVAGNNDDIVNWE